LAECVRAVTALYGVRVYSRAMCTKEIRPQIPSSWVALGFHAASALFEWVGLDAIGAKHVQACVIASA
jgi:hypothetical protein